MEGVLNDGCVSHQQVSDEQQEAQGECEVEEQEWPSHVVDSSHYNYNWLRSSLGVLHAEALSDLYIRPSC